MLYHRDVYLPEAVTALRFAVMLRYGSHAKNAATNDKNGRINLPTVFDSRKAEVIEAEVQNDRVVKVLYRMAHDEKNDLCIVLHPSDGFVRTVWLNQKDDSHKTLDRSRYAKG